MAINATGISRDLLIHPGEILHDVICDRGISQATLAVKTGKSAAFISKVIKGEKDISSDFASSLEYALGMPKIFWLNLQAKYDSELQEICDLESISDSERLAFSDLSEIVKYLTEQHELPKCSSAEYFILELRRLFGISRLDNLPNLIPQASFRMKTNNPINPTVLGAWMTLCKQRTECISVDVPFNRNNIDSLTDEIKCIMTERLVSDWCTDLTELFAKYGIAFAVVHNFRGAPAHGFVTKREDGTYQMVVTIRNKHADIFWFSLFHELGHIYNGDISTRKNVYLDLQDTGDQELAADAFASSRLLDEEAYLEFKSIHCASGIPSAGAVKSFSRSQKVDPCIVVGRLHHDNLVPWNRLNELTKRLTWVD